MNRSVRRNLSVEFQAETSRGHQERIFVLLRHPRLHFHLFQNDRKIVRPQTFVGLPVEIVASEEGQEEQQHNQTSHHHDDQHHLLLADFFLQQNI